ncbi:MAG: alpha/beta fold hydrolase [Thermoanaerobaculia bacterium]
MPPLRFLTLLALAAGLVTTLGCVSLRPVAAVRAERGAPSGRAVATSGAGLYVELAGEPDGPAVVLLHGFGGSLYSWRKVVPPLAGAGFRVVAVDLAGFGYSERPADRFLYTPEGQASLVAEALEGLGVEAAHVLGHSFGGGVALRLAAGARDGRSGLEVRSLVLVDSTLPTHSRAPRADWPFFRPVSYLLLRTVGLRRFFVRKALEEAFHDDGQVTPELVDAYRRRLLLRGPAGAYASLTGPLPRRRLEAELEAVHQPTLVLWGAEDALIPLRAGRRAARRLPDARFVAIPECGHIPMEECPEAFLDAVLEFFEGPGR